MFARFRRPRYTTRSIENDHVRLSCTRLIPITARRRTKGKSVVRKYKKTNSKNFKFFMYRSLFYVQTTLCFRNAYPPTETYKNTFSFPLSFPHAPSVHTRSLRIKMSNFRCRLNNTHGLARAGWINGVENRAISSSPFLNTTPSYYSVVDSFVE